MKLSTLPLTEKERNSGDAQILGMVTGSYPAISDGFKKAEDKMVQSAEKMNADIVCDVHYVSSPSEVCIYGTAFKLNTET